MTFTRHFLLILKRSVVLPPPTSRRGSVRLRVRGYPHDPLGRTFRVETKLGDVVLCESTSLSSPTRRSVTRTSDFFVVVRGVSVRDP